MPHTSTGLCTYVCTCTDRCVLCMYIHVCGVLGINPGTLRMLGSLPTDSHPQPHYGFLRVKPKQAEGGLSSPLSPGILSTGRASQLLPLRDQPLITARTCFSAQVLLRMGAVRGSAQNPGP